MIKKKKKSQNKFKSKTRRARGGQEDLSTYQLSQYWMFTVTKQPTWWFSCVPLDFGLFLSHLEAHLMFLSEATYNFVRLQPIRVKFSVPGLCLRLNLLWKFQLKCVGGLFEQAFWKYNLVRRQGNSLFSLLAEADEWWAGAHGRALTAAQ